MKLDKLVVGILDTNCYILTINNNCLIIDPGSEYDRIMETIGNNKLLGIIVTHSHSDHIGALKKFDKNLILDINNLEEKEYKIGDFVFEVIYTPGHKEDCITIYFRKEKIMFTGDFIFKGTIGRIDLPGGNYKDMVNSLAKIEKYDKDIKIYPGHGHSTVLGDEMKNKL